MTTSEDANELLMYMNQKIFHNCHDLNPYGCCARKTTSFFSKIGLELLSSFGKRRALSNDLIASSGNGVVVMDAFTPDSL